MRGKEESILMDRFFAEAETHDWDLAAIRPKVCWEQGKTLGGYPRFVLRTFFSKYKKRAEEKAPAEVAAGDHSAMDVEVDDSGSAETCNRFVCACVCVCVCVW
jgi:hypothetical protein